MRIFETTGNMNVSLISKVWSGKCDKFRLEGVHYELKKPDTKENLMIQIQLSIFDIGLSLIEKSSTHKLPAKLLVNLLKIIQINERDKAVIRPLEDHH